jgi:SAM-dependent methyltransferase
LREADLRRLLEPGVAGEGGEWADLGSGDGAFTLVLAALLGPEGRIHSVDRDAGALARQARELDQRARGSKVELRVGDFTRPLRLPPLDGALMANSLHFQRDKRPVLELVRGYLKPGGTLVLVEYGSDRGNPWVPYPLAYPTWERLAAECGFLGTRFLASVPSRFLGSIYSAASQAP